MPSANENIPKVSSPEASGGGGTIFEEHVDAACLALLLVGAIPPVLTDCQTTEVHFQTGHLGWKTDDILLVGKNGFDRRRRLAIQVKDGFVLSKRDEECVKTIAAFWKDFRNASLFTQGCDALALVVHRGTATLLTHLNALLDCARASLDANDFADRLAPENYMSVCARKYAEDIRAIISVSQKEPISDENFLTFLQHMHFWSWDLGTPSGHTEALIKTLLKISTSHSDQLGAANASWNLLLRLAGTTMHTAFSYTWDKLPQELLDLYSQIKSIGRETLLTLKGHSAVVLDGIRTTIGGTAHLSRRNLLSQAFEQLENDRILVITGPSGYGKSAIAKRVCEHFQGQHFVFAFRAEEFAVPHIDDALHQAQVSQNAESLRAILCGQGRKILLIESVERLLEASVRDGFTDLLRLVNKDFGWRLVLTCRDYSLNVVRSSFLDQAGLAHSVLTIPPLDEEELEEVVDQCPSLRRPAANPKLRKILSNPYYLDKAARMNWLLDSPLPEDERSFRQQFWRDVVRDDSNANGGMPLRREQAYIEISLRRARSLKPFVDCSNVDMSAVSKLQQADLLAFQTESSAAVAPSHDVLEDWAIITWLQGIFIQHDGDASQIATNVAGYPALRRAYRKWLGEILYCESGAADAFVLRIIEDPQLHDQFRDDTIVSVLLSPKSADFVVRHRSDLIADNCALLMRTVHLLRVACVTTPRGIAPGQQLWLGTFVPDGDAWVEVLKLIQDQLPVLLPSRLGTILGLIEDWTKLLTWWNVEPEGIGPVACVAFALLPYLQSYRSDKLRKRVLLVIIRVPSGDSTSFLELMERASGKQKENKTTKEFGELLLTGMNSTFVCQLFPDAICNLTMRSFCMDDIPSGFHHGDSTELEPTFGLRPYSRHDFFPASAWRGPFRPLLRSHSDQGLDLIIRLLEHASTWYGDKKWPIFRIEPAYKVTLSVPDSAQRTYWANHRLWCLYRGTTVGPYVLQTALMALETWLLEQCEDPSFDLEQWLLKILNSTNTIALVSVVASVSLAHPQRAGRAAVALLTGRELFDMDRQRMIFESSASHTLSDCMPSWNPEHRLYGHEREEASKKPHRNHHLEWLALNLQLGIHKETVWDILDKYRRELPPVKKQKDEDRLWRLALHRMDIRTFEPANPTKLAAFQKQFSLSKESEPQNKEGVYFLPKSPDADIQAMLDKQEPEQVQQNQDLALSNWAFAVWRRAEPDKYPPQEWYDRLKIARERWRAPSDPFDIYQNGPGYVAAICTRDHWSEMDVGDKQWCTKALIAEVENNCNSDEYLAIVSRSPFSPSRPAAFVIPVLLSYTVSHEVRTILLNVLAKALTHAVGEVAEWAAAGVSAFLTDKSKDILVQCVAGLLLKANLLSKQSEFQQEVNYDERVPYAELSTAAKVQVREALSNGKLDFETEWADFDWDSYDARWVIGLIMTMLSRCNGYPVAIEVYRKAAQYLVNCWTLDRNNSKRRDRNYHLEHEIRDRLVQFALKLGSSDAIALCNPILNILEDEPDEVGTFIESLVIAEDQIEGATSFWEIWQAVAEIVKAACWVERLDDEHAPDGRLIYRMFLGAEWKKDVRHWRKLDGNSQRLDALFDGLPPSSRVLECYCNFLYSIGRRSLPNAFNLIANRLQSSKSPSTLLSNVNTRYILEVLLAHFVYGKPRETKTNAQLRKSILLILDLLVDAGSSAAYRMRDDFVTPLETVASTGTFLR